MLIVFSVIFPQNLLFFRLFLGSLKGQTDRNFKLFLVNDGVNNIHEYLADCDFEIEVINVNGLQPFEIRIVGLRELLRTNKSIVKYIIFSDTDDLMSPNRIEFSKKYLKDYPFVCNDLSLISNSGLLLTDSIWSKRIENNFEFDFNFLIDKNIIGFGNSGMHAGLLIPVLEKLKDITHGNDWLFFSSFAHQIRAIFLKDCKTLYRQHDNNLIGNKKLSVERLLQIVKVKINHYSTLKSIGISLFDLDQFISENTSKLKYLINDKDESIKQSEDINLLNINFFWWEESNYLKIK